jgi:hypothetical protein
MTDFSRLRLRRNRKQYLIAPAELTIDPPHRPAPSFAIAVHQLAGDFRRHALEQPGITLRDVSIDGRKLELVHRSGMFKVTTWISAEFLPGDDNQSTLAIYSRTNYGNRTVNRRRIDSWLTALGAPDEVQLEASPPNA